MKVRVCPNCGKHNLELAFHCVDCGETLSVDTLTEIESEKFPNSNLSTGQANRTSTSSNQTFQNNKDIKIIIACEKCGQKLRIPQSRTKLIVTCPTCRHEFAYEFVDKNLETNSLGKKPPPQSNMPYEKATDNRKMKKCPFCAEEIRFEAIICRYCGRELAPPKPKYWKYETVVYHWRNADEGGWINAENTPGASAAQHFWNDMNELVVLLDKIHTDNGWEVFGPRDPSCVRIELVRNSKGYDPVLSTVNAIFTYGGSLIRQARGFQKWWPTSLTLRWRIPSDKNEEETIDYWLSLKNKNEFERV